MSSPSSEPWRPCSACKKPIGLGAPYYVCSVSTCNRKRTGLVFCSVSCWEVHLPAARHREAWAEEATAPKERHPEADNGEADTGEAGKAAAAAQPRVRKRRLVRPLGTERPEDDVPREVLIVASRLKDYVRARSGYNTSDRVLQPLSELLRAICDEAIRNARREGRTTVLDRDIPRS